MKVSFQHLSHTLAVDLSKSPALLTEWQRVAVAAFQSTVLKKMVDQKDPTADACALSKFLASNKRCEEWVLRKDRLVDDYLIGEFKVELDRFWYLTGDHSLVSHPRMLFANGRTGPGVAIGASGKDHFAKLFNSKLSCTSTSLYDMYRTVCRESPILDHAEKARISDFGDYQIVSGNRIAFVPKTNEVSRTICVEPSLNLFYQFGLGEVLSARLRSFYNTDLATQPNKQRDLAYSGSKQDHIVTLDLSSASDTISKHMLREMLPREWYMWLDLFRSPYVSLPDGSTVELHMISSMGNAYTFPLETIIFRAIISAAVRVSGLDLDTSLIGVFGDDMIYPKSIHGLVTRLLDLLGFVANAEKTFVEGLFRESCGHDYFDGHDVRPVYLKTVETQQDRYVAINLLLSWVAKTGVSLSETIGLLCSSVSRHYVPMHESLDAGILVPQSFLRKKVADPNGSLTYQAFRAVPTLQRIGRDGMLRGPQSRNRSYNPAGLLMTFLRGYIRDGAISLRQERPTYALNRCVTPHWDYVPTDSALGQLLKPDRTEHVIRRWNYAAHLSL